MQFDGIFAWKNSINFSICKLFKAFKQSYQILTNAFSHCSHLDIYISQKTGSVCSEFVRPISNEPRGQTYSDLLYSFFFYFFQELSNPVLFGHCWCYFKKVEISESSRCCVKLQIWILQLFGIAATVCKKHCLWHTACFFVKCKCPNGYSVLLIRICAQSIILCKDLIFR